MSEPAPAESAYSSYVRAPVTHWLLTDPPQWDALARGEKTCEIRNNDRGFQTSDILRLVRTEPRHLQDAFSINLKTALDQQVIEARITWINDGGRYGVTPGYVVLSLNSIRKL